MVYQTSAGILSLSHFWHVGGIDLQEYSSSELWEKLDFLSAENPGFIHDRNQGHAVVCK